MPDYDDSTDKGRSHAPYPSHGGPAQKQRRAGSQTMRASSGMLPPRKTAPPAVVMRKADGTVAPPLPFTAIPADLAAWAFQPHIPMAAPQTLVQARGDIGGPSVHEAAAEGVSGSGSALPHAERIQAAFGPAHDISHVQAHVDGAAAAASEAIGAEAYATGHHIAFREAPDVHTAAHEAAHVIQQQQGVQLRGGVGQAGDVYERHADAVADRVVAGQSAADLLAAGPTGGGRSAGVASSQTPRGPVDASQNLQNPTLNPSCSGTDDVPGIDAHVGGAAAPVQQSAIQFYTKVPTGTAPYDLISDDGKMAARDHKRDAWAEASLIAKSNDVLAAQKAKAKIAEVGATITVKPPGMPAGPDITLKKFRMEDVAAGTEVELVDDCGTANQQMLGAEAAGSLEFVAANKRGTTHEFTNSEGYHADDFAPGGVVSTTEALSGQIYIRIFKREFSMTLSRVDALAKWAALSASEKDRLSKKYGINKYATPRVGQGITIGSERDMPGAVRGGYNFHFGLALITSGEDYLTLEDYDSSGVKYYFDMYGPASKQQSWAEDPSNTGALGNKTTTMVVQHPESLKGKTNAVGVHFVDDPATSANKRLLAKDTEVKIIRRGHSWMNVQVLTGPRVGEQGWILNRFYTDS